jgi:fucose permease
VRTALILGRRTVYQLDPAALARLNSVFIAMFCVGGAVGSPFGSVVQHAGGWTALGAALPLIALLYWTTDHQQGEAAKPRTASP